MDEKVVLTIEEYRLLIQLLYSINRLYDELTKYLTGGEHRIVLDKVKETLKKLEGDNTNE